MSRIRALVSPAIRPAWLELAPPFEKSSGHHLATEWAGIAAIRKRIGEGEVFDLVVGSAASIDELVEKKKLFEKKDLAQAEAGVGVRTGARRPDLSSVEALKRELRAARKIGLVTTFTAGFPENTQPLKAAIEWVAWFTAPAAAPVLRKHGLEPA